ncbi:unnamed protein product [Adineta steineri]|uniref:Lebercilin domain-containing protein n=1 Tax=Adineta steineri TaxID=433720 RepID=A0A815MXP4_9BILA|nr:unnamed protein product [Adineta steineri]
MPKRSGSGGSSDEFEPELNFNKDGDNKKSKQNNLPTSSGISGLIRNQPLIHTRQTPSETKPNVNSTTPSMTTNGKNTSDAQPAKANESDIDDKKKPNSQPPPKQRPQEAPRRTSDSEVKASYTTPSDGTPRKAPYLPYIRPRNRQKPVAESRPSRQTKSDAEQRVSSAQDEKLKDLRSRLLLIRQQLEEERIENKTLRKIKKREDKSLQNYEDQEYSARKVAQEYQNEIEYYKTQIHDEKEAKMNIQKEADERDQTLRDQTKRVKFYEKLIATEDDYDDYDDLRERFKETDKSLKKFEEKISKQEKYIQNLEQKYRQEITQELIKRRELKNDIADQSKKYTDLLLKYENKSRQVDTMHIYIQHGGRRPSDSSSVNLAKSRSFQDVHDTSPQFREKMLDYDKKRREQDKDKPKPPPLRLTPPPKPKRKVYVPSINLKPKPKPEVKQPSPEPPRVIYEEKSPLIKIAPVKSPVRRLSTPSSYDDDDNSEFEEDVVIEPAHLKHRTPTPPPRISLPPPRQRTPPELMHKPIGPPPPPPVKPEIKPPTRDFDSKWLNMFANEKKEQDAKNDLLSKLTTDEPQEKKPRPSMITFEPPPAPAPTNNNPKKPPPRVVTSVYDFEQAVLNLHDGKPVTAQPTTTTAKRPSLDPFESLSNNTNNKPTNRIYNPDDFFNKTQTKPNSFESHFTQPSSEANTLPTTKPNSKQLPPQNDKLQRPKVVTNIPRPIPNRTVVEEIEDFLV